MVAYSFQPRFVEPIRAGTKGGTIRAPRRYPARWSEAARYGRPGGHAIPGEFVDLYCRQRSPSGFFICQHRCQEVHPIRLDFRARRLSIGGSILSNTLLDSFAVFDGFKDWEELAAFWRETHGPIDAFDGWQICWSVLRL